jgi:hypothetical protein
VSKTRLEKLFEAYRASKEPNFQIFLKKLKEESENVIDATDVFKEKQRQDKWWDEALERQRKIDKGNKDE